jgi:hypothetical protein
VSAAEDDARECEANSITEDTTTIQEITHRYNRVILCYSLALGLMVTALGLMLIDNRPLRAEIHQMKEAQS